MRIKGGSAQDGAATQLGRSGWQLLLPTRSEHGVHLRVPVEQAKAPPSSATLETTAAHFSTSLGEEEEGSRQNMNRWSGPSGALGLGSKTLPYGDTFTHYFIHSLTHSCHQFYRASALR